MKLVVTLSVLLLALLVAGSQAFEAIVPADKDKPNKNDTTNATDAKDKDKDNNNPTLDKMICDICHCIPKTHIIDCEEKRLIRMFSDVDWMMLNKTQIPMDVVRLGHNELPRVYKFPALPIIVLDLSHNDIVAIENQAFIELFSLEELDLSHNQLTSEALTPAVFEGKFAATEYEPIRSLKKLNIGSNNIHILKPDLFEHFPNLEVLVLESNPFKTIDLGTEIAISSILTLRSLDMSYMELSMLPVNMFHAPLRLEILNLTGNLFTTLPDALQFAVNLKHLSLDENPIGDIVGENRFPILIKLESLSISYMPHLVTIGNGGLSGLENLEELYATNNPHLTHIHPSAFSRKDKDEPTREDWPQLQSLYLHNNNLSTLDSHLLGRWDQLHMIDIRANPWQCDCENQWLIETLIPDIISTQPTITTNIVCASPKQMVGNSLFDLNQKHSNMRCLDKYNNHPERDGPILMGLLIGLVIGIPFTLAVILIYKRGCLGLFGQRGPADYSRAFYKRATTHDEMNI